MVSARQGPAIRRIREGDKRVIIDIHTRYGFGACIARHNADATPFGEASAWLAGERVTRAASVNIDKREN